MTNIDPNLSQPESNDPNELPQDRFVDALLAHKFSETRESMDARIDRVLRSIHAKPSRAHSIRSWHWWAIPLAALIAISILFMPTSSSASAVVQSAARVARKSVDRQYQVILIPKGRRVSDQPPPIFATLDVRDSQHMRIEIHFQGGRTEIHGRDGDTSWQQRPDGSAIISDRNIPWPRWVETPDGSLLVDSMAEMLKDLDDSYDIAKVDDAQACGRSGLLQIRASRQEIESVVASQSDEKLHRNPAERIEMCIDPATNEVIRLEMFFPVQSGPGPSDQHGPPPPPMGERGSPPPMGERGSPPPMGERGSRPPMGERGSPRGGGPHGPLGPPQSISFERTETTSFPSDWFKAPAHAVEADPTQ